MKHLYIVAEKYYGGYSLITTYQVSTYVRCHSVSHEHYQQAYEAGFTISIFQMSIQKPGEVNQLATVTMLVAEIQPSPAFTKALDFCALLPLLIKNWFSSLTYKNRKKLIFYDSKLFY